MTWLILGAIVCSFGLVFSIAWISDIAKARRQKEVVYTGSSSPKWDDDSQENVGNYYVVLDSDTKMFDRPEDAQAHVDQIFKTSRARGFSVVAVPKANIDTAMLGWWEVDLHYMLMRPATRHVASVSNNTVVLHCHGSEAVTKAMALHETLNN